MNVDAEAVVELGLGLYQVRSNTDEPHYSIITNIGTRRITHIQVYEEPSRRLWVEEGARWYYILAGELYQGHFINEDDWEMVWDNIKDAGGRIFTTFNNISVNGNKRVYQSLVRRLSDGFCRDTYF